MDGNNQLPLQSNEGFTLLEILIALVIISIGLLSLASISISVIRANSVANKMTQMTALAQDRLEILRKTSFASLQTGSTTASPPDNININWTVTQPQTNLKQINLTATWTDSTGKTHSLTFGTLIASP